MKQVTPFILPVSANIPKEWIVHEDGFTQDIVFPSWSNQRGSYICTLQKFTRELTCPCKGFTFNHICHHVRGIRWASVKEKKGKKKSGSGVSDTSMDSIHSFTPEQLGARQLKVFETLRDDGPLSIREIAEELEWPEHCVTGRLMEVREMGVVDYVTDKMDGVTNRRVSLWGVV
jgi:predicted transcriptional regulator